MKARSITNTPFIAAGDAKIGSLRVACPSSAERRLKYSML